MMIRKSSLQSVFSVMINCRVCWDLSRNLHLIFIIATDSEFVQLGMRRKIRRVYITDGQKVRSGSIHANKESRINRVRKTTPIDPR